MIPEVRLSGWAVLRSAAGPSGVTLAAAGGLRHGRELVVSFPRAPLGSLLNCQLHFCPSGLVGPPGSVQKFLGRFGLEFVLGNSLIFTEIQCFELNSIDFH